MNDDERRFWVVIIGAVVVKLILSPTVNWRTNTGQALIRAFMTGVPAVWAAYTFTDPVLALIGWDADQYRNMMAGLLALAGENLIRRILEFTGSDANLLRLLQLWFGGGPKK